MSSLALVVASLLLQAAPDTKPTLVVAGLQAVDIRTRDAKTLEEMVRALVVRSGRYTLVTPEETEALDDEVKRQLTGGCDEASCIREYAGALGARYLITGRISPFGRRLVLNLKLLDIEQRSAVNILRLKAASLEGMDEQLDARFHELIGGRRPRSTRRSQRPAADDRGRSGRYKTSRLSSVAPQPGPRVQGSSIRNPTGWLSVTAKHRGTQVTLHGRGVKERFALDGGRPWLKQLAPGRYSWKARGHGREAEQGSINVVPDQTTALNIRLKEPGNLIIQGSPKGAKVEVWGPRKFHTVKGLPLRISAAPRGSYRLRVSSPGYKQRQYRATVRSGATSTVRVKLRQTAQQRAAQRAAKKPASKAEQINQEISFLYGEMVGFGDAEHGHTGAWSGTLWFQAEGLPGLNLPALHLGYTIPFQGASSLDLEHASGGIWRLGYEHYLMDSDDQLLPFGLFVNALVAGDVGLELGTNVYMLSIPDKKRQEPMMGSTLKLTAFVGASDRRGVYGGIGFGISWAGALMLVFAAASGG